MKAQTKFLIVATLSTGLMAGIFFTWANAVTIGIGKLADAEYLRSFQEMNRSILNPSFFLVIFTPVILLPILSFMNFKAQPALLFWILLSASLIYIIGVMVITFAGNVPLNNLLDKTGLENISIEDAKALRSIYEGKWNSLNWVRTYCSLGAFILMIISCIFGTN